MWALWQQGLLVTIGSASRNNRTTIAEADQKDEMKNRETEDTKTNMVLT